MSKKEKFPLYLSPEKKAILERRYQEDGSRSITAFIERAVDFYLDYLSANNAGGGRRAFKMCGKPMAASRWSSGCVEPGGRTMSGRIDREKPLSQVRWRQ